MKQRVKHIILLIVAGWIALVAQMATAFEISGSTWRMFHQTKTNYVDNNLCVI